MSSPQMVCDPSLGQGGAAKSKGSGRVTMLCGGTARSVLRACVVAPRHVRERGWALRVGLPTRLSQSWGPTGTIDGRACDVPRTRLAPTGTGLEEEPTMIDLQALITTLLVLFIVFLGNRAWPHMLMAWRWAGSQARSCKRHITHRRRMRWIRERQFQMVNLSHLAKTADEYRLRHPDCWTSPMLSVFWKATNELFQNDIAEEVVYDKYGISFKLHPGAVFGMTVRGGRSADRDWSVEHYASRLACTSGAYIAPDMCLCGRHYYDHFPHHAFSRCLGRLLPPANGARSRRKRDGAFLSGELARGEALRESEAGGLGSYSVAPTALEGEGDA